MFYEGERRIGGDQSRISIRVETNWAIAADEGLDCLRLTTPTLLRPTLPRGEQSLLDSTAECSPGHGPHRFSSLSSRYTGGTLYSVPCSSLQGLVERPGPCKYNVILYGFFFHGGNTGSN